MKKLLPLFILFCLIVFEKNANAISGHVTSDSTWSGTIAITGNIIIDQYVTLTIIPGTRIGFDGNYSITVNGAINASGTLSEKIVFTSNQSTPAPGNWVGLSFTSLSGYVPSVISNCEFYYASNALAYSNIPVDYTMNVSSCLFDNISGDAVLVNNSQVDINGCTIQNFGNNGVSATGVNSKVTVSNSQIIQVLQTRLRTANGIYGTGGADFTVTGNTISRCNIGIHGTNTNTAPAFDVSGNTITDNYRGFYFYCYNNLNSYAFPQVTVRHNNIHSNSDRNVYVDRGSYPRSTELDFRDNWWGSTDGVNIASKIYDYSNSTYSAFVNYLPFLNGPFDQGGTSTSGNFKAGLIHDNTTWTLAGSPYVVTGKIVVEGARTLTIEPGVEIRFQTGSLEVDGAIDASGTLSDRIVFTSNQTTPAPGNWGGISFTSLSGYVPSVISNCEFYYASNALAYSNIPVDYTMNVSSCLFDNISGDAVLVNNSQVDINGCTIQNFGNNGVSATGVNSKVTVSNSQIIQVLQTRLRTANGIYGTGGADFTVTGNTISRCNNGIHGYNTNTAPTFDVSGNTITDNYRGFYFYCYNNLNSYAFPQVTVRHNNIHSNSDRNVYVDRGSSPRSTELDFRDNWWGSTDGVNIASKIYDYSNSTYSAFVNYLPFLNGPFDQGGTSTSGNFKAGLIHDNTTWTLAGSPYIAIGEIIVDQLKTLTLEAGVVVRFQSDGITVDGTLVANGTETQKITFTSNQSSPLPGNYTGITITSLTGSPASLFRYCDFQYATNALTFSSISANNSTLVTSSVFNNISNTAINVTGSIVGINSCTITNGH